MYSHISRLALIISLTTAGACAPANAALVNNGTFITDTSTGLDWYKLSSTFGMSYNSVLSQIQTGGSLDTWTVASRNEVVELFQNAGVAPEVTANGIQPTFFDQPSWLSTQALMDLLGVGYDNNSQSQGFTMTVGMFGPVHSHPPFLNNVVDVAALILYKPETYGGEYVHSYGITAANGTGGHNFARDSASGTGSFLVRSTQAQPISEPKHLVFLALAAAFLCRRTQASQTKPS